MAGGEDGNLKKGSFLESHMDDYCVNNANGILNKQMPEENDFKQIEELRDAVQLTKGRISKLQKDLELRDNEVELQISLRKFAENKLTAVQSSGVIEDTNFSESENSFGNSSLSYMMPRKPPIKPPRRKHSMNKDPSLKESFKEIHPSDTSDLSSSNSNRRPFSQSNSKLQSAFSLPNVGNLRNSSINSFSATHSHQSENLNWSSSSDSLDDSCYRKETRKCYRRSRHNSIKSNQGNRRISLKSKSNNIVPLVPSSNEFFIPQQFPVAFYPVSITDCDVNSITSSNAQKLSIVPSKILSSESKNNSKCHPSSEMPNLNIPNASKYSPQCKDGHKHHKRSSSDPLDFDSNTINNISNERKLKEHGSGNIPFVKNIPNEKISASNITKDFFSGKHSSKFAALLEEIYTAQKMRDEAMAKRMENIIKDKNSRLSLLDELDNKQYLSKGYDDNSITSYDANDKINDNLEMIENAQSPTQIRKHGRKLLEEVNLMKKNKDSDLQNYVYALQNERDSILKKNKQLESELEHYHTANESALNNSTLSNIEENEDTSMLRLCYSLHKSVIQDRLLQNSSNNSNSMNLSNFDISDVNSSNDDDITNLKKQLKEEKEARELAEKKCEKLEMAVGLLRKKVNKMNGFDGFELSLP